MENEIHTAEAMETCRGKAEQWTVEGVPQLIRSAASDDEGPDVIVLACRWRYFAGCDINALKRLASEVDYRVVRVPCSGQVPGEWVSEALESGAEAVMVLGGHDGCRFSGHSAEGELRDRVASDGLEPERAIADWRTENSLEGIEGAVDRVIVTVRSPSGRR